MFLALLAGTLIAAPPTIDVYTMGIGDAIFEHFGHAAICVTDERTPLGRCYNYGTADFSTPVPLTWSFIRGRAMFWVSVLDLRRMIEFYESYDRTVWKQTIPLSPERAAALAAALERSSHTDEKYYRYHHFLDNCTTRIRDHLDQAIDGDLYRRTQEPLDGATFREYARRGFAGDAGLLLAAELVLGRSSDRPTSAWEGMFLPEIFRRELETKLGAKPVAVYLRQKKDIPGSENLGRGLLLTLGVIFSGVILLGWRIGPRARRVSLVLTGLILGLFGTIFWGLALVSAFEELRANEILLVFFPFDVALGILPEKIRRIYSLLRLGVLLIVVLLAISGLFIQPLFAPLLFVALPLLCSALIRG
jgi:hypothetical protein